MDLDNVNSIFKSRYRSPIFKKAETLTLLNLIERYKKYILNKSTNDATNRRKEIAWLKITKLYNACNIGVPRSKDCLRHKWLNLKARIARSSFEESSTSDFEEVHKKLFQLANEDINSITDTNSSLSEESDSDVLNEVVRYKSPRFTEKETKILLNLVEKYKFIILDKCCNTAALANKDKAWEVITSEFNKSDGIGMERTTDMLKNRWSNLKKESRRLSANLLESQDYDEVMAHLLSILSSVESCDGNESSQNNNTELDIENNDLNEITLEIEHGFEDSEKTTKKESDDSEDEGEHTLQETHGISNEGRSSNFSMQETKLLLQCVRMYKDQILTPGNSITAVRLKNYAWKKVAETFNKRNPTFRSVKTLRFKFQNLRRFTGARKNSSRREHPSFEQVIKKKQIKSEPSFEYTKERSLSPDLPENGESKHLFDKHKNSQDPLNLVFNSTNGCNFDAWCLQESPEVVKMKLDLLKYKMETAKLKRKRLQEAIEADSSERESRKIEQALRLRLGRLEVLAAEARLTSMGALPMQYTELDAPAQEYMEQHN